MNSLIATGVSGLLASMIVFGVAPRLALRLMLRAFPDRDDRRAELTAELSTVPRWERPIWVAEQLEVVLVEAVLPRLGRSPGWIAEKVIQVAFRSRRIRADLLEGLSELPQLHRLHSALRESLTAWTTRWRIVPGEEMAEEYPDLPMLPDEEMCATVVPGASVKLIFEEIGPEHWGEGMWVTVTSRRGDRVRGRLSNDPVGFPTIGPNSKVKFRVNDVRSVNPEL